MGDILDKVDKAREILKKTNIKLHKLAGECAANPDIDDIQKAAAKAKGSIENAIKVRKILQKDSKVLDTLNAANNQLGSIGDSLSKIKEICIDIKAVGDIYEALNTLDDDLIINNPEESAKAFGQLFVGFGRLFRYFPPPFCSWGTFFMNAADFFTNVSRAVSPEHVAGIRRQFNEMEKMSRN